ncbi:hypothetical protein PIB30_084554 [Stylosanthes scabra]|uniref:tRNA(His) guanylyltransferase n=1 Tax=Stylosanthes scabra TaxID=79078 RepID=A0ABU6TUR8_9FABA|nr:hypothetical protein [Stylosanthes scabra]
MANSKYEYVKNFELEDEVMFPNFILVRINGRNFSNFSRLHRLQKPYDENALNLMNSCAVSVLEEYADIVLAYGFSDEYTFVFKKTSKFYDRRASKVLSTITSFFSSIFVTKWSDFFPQKELQYSPSFHGHVTSCALVDVLQAYLLWRQNICHATNQYDQCFWRLVECGKDVKEAHDLLKRAEKCNLNNLLFDKFNVNYNTLEPIFRQGSCVLKVVVDDIVKYTDNGVPIKRQRRKIITMHSKKIAGRKFCNEQTFLSKELGCFVEDIDNVKPEYVKSFEFDSKLMPLTWIVVRIDGCHFHRFSELHEFVKPNDERALNLMNSCAMSVLEEFPHDIVFAYGVSDEYSFVLKKTTDLFQRRAMCYPSIEILRDYLSWRQVDCHINNQYNSCFWKLVGSGNLKREAQQSLKGAQLQKKIEELAIDYNSLPAMFRQGSSVFWDNVLTCQQNGKSSESCGRVIVEHCDIIGSGFWLEHPSILEEKQ